MVYLNSQQVKILTGLDLEFDDSIWIRETQEFGYLVDWDSETTNVSI